MRKNDLKSGMAVECRNGCKFLVIVENAKLVRTDGFMYLNDYNDDLRIKPGHNHDYDIIAIYNPNWVSVDYTLAKKCGEPIWRRPPEVKEMTIAEIEKELGYPIKVVK